MTKTPAHHASGADPWGVERGYWATDGSWHETSDETRAALRRAMLGATAERTAPIAHDPTHPPPGPPVWIVPAGWGEALLGPCRLVLEDGTDAGVVTGLAPDVPIGRHRLEPVDGGPTTLLIVRPQQCHDLARRASALAVQAYAARSRRSWGIGDHGDLRRLGTWARGEGVDLMALSPLGAPSPGDHPQPSPYYPSSRRHLAPLHLCVEDIEGATSSDLVAELAAEARRLLDVRRIDRGAAWSAKRRALEHLFEVRGPGIDREIESFRAERGEDLERWAVFCTIAELHPGPWPQWPVELRHPDSPAVARIARDHSDRVRYHCWLQWLGDRQLRATAEACPLITDLAVGVDPGGADAWIDQDLLALGARVGAPPDDFATDGQDWGLPPYVPHLLRTDGYEAFARTLRTSMRHGAGVRIDHVLGLFRLFWIPEGEDATTGAYVRYPADELLAVLAIESVRTRCAVIGEDLGTVEDGVRDSLAQTGVLGTRVLWFEDDPPARWPERVAAAITTHDLPTITGLWTGADARGRADVGLPADRTEVLRDRLVGLGEGLGDATPPADVVVAAHRAIAKSPAQVAIGTLDDVLQVPERPNMPGTIDEWPNWSIALPHPIDDLTSAPAPATLRALTDRGARPPDGGGGGGGHRPDR